MADRSDSPAVHRPKLVLVDAYSLLFRAFFAGRPLTTTDNRPTGALFGFTSMMFTLLGNEKPDAIVVCWDAPEQTNRSKEFEAYKAHRPAPDPQLKAQMPVARRIVEAFGMQSAEVGGFEADDLIGTLATRGVHEGYHVVILTGDSDQLQLVGDGVVVQMTQRGVTDVRVYDAEAVRTRYGVGPERIADWKALVGDTSDNIPGVPGIGDKTATALLQKWGSLENLLEHVADVTPAKAHIALQSNIDQARVSKRLATIVCDAPIDMALRPFAPTPDDWARLREVFADLEFKSLLSRIPRSGDAPVIEAERVAPEEVFAGQAILIDSEEALQQALAEVKKAGRVAIQIEADSSVAMRAALHGIAFSCSLEVGYYVAVQRQAPPMKAGMGGLFDEDLDDNDGADDDQGFAVPLAALHTLLKTEGLDKIGYNTKVAEIVLERHGARITPFTFDVQIAAYLLNAGRSSYPLTDLVETHLNLRLEGDDPFAPGEKLAREAAAIFALVPMLRESLDKVGMTEIMDGIETPLVPVLAAIEEAGLLIDESYMGTLAVRMGGELNALASEIYRIAGETFDIGSTKQLQTILFDKLQMPTGKKTKTGFSTGADLLESLAAEHEIARKIIDWREVSKLKSTYADALTKLINPTTGRVHTSLNQTRTSTGRLSSSDPNVQNIPIRSEIGREIRQAFIAPKGKMLLSCDYSQIELRLLAHITKDPALVEAFQADEDIHAATAATVFSVPIEEVTPDQRRQAKTINFAVIYGQSGFSLAATLGVSASIANTWIKDYFDRLPGVKRYVEETTELARNQKYVSTLLGRRRYMPEVDSPNHAIRQAGERAAVNMPIQGTAADIMKLAMIAVQKYLHAEFADTCTLVLQVHDELLLEVETSALGEITPHVVRLMESAYPLDIRLRTDAKAGRNWADMKSV